MSFAGRSIPSRKHWPSGLKWLDHMTGFLQLGALAFQQVCEEICFIDDVEPTLRESS